MIGTRTPVKEIDYQQWGKYIEERLKRNFQKNDIHVGPLYNSIVQSINTMSDGNPNGLALFVFKQYGIYVERGVGKGCQENAFQNGTRVKKPWFSASFWGQVQKLKELVGESKGKEMQQAIGYYYTKLIGNE